MVCRRRNRRVTERQLSRLMYGAWYLPRGSTRHCDDIVAGGRAADKSDGQASQCDKRGWSKIEINHHFAVNPFGDLCYVSNDLLVLGVLGKHCLCVLIGSRIGVRHNDEPVTHIRSCLKALSPNEAVRGNVDGEAARFRIRTVKPPRHSARAMPTAPPVSQRGIRHCAKP